MRCKNLVSLFYVKKTPYKLVYFLYPPTHTLDFLVYFLYLCVILLHIKTTRTIWADTDENHLSAD